ncbi:hypothetical protein Bbelb_417070 [Branchiostoma belcheri]|nr:hypothetical protein Bbelb_417070 [Branchiostoma belcheri]
MTSATLHLHRRTVSNTSLLPPDDVVSDPTQPSGVAFITLAYRVGVLRTTRSPEPRPFRLDPDCPRLAPPAVPLEKREMAGSQCPLFSSSTCTGSLVWRLIRRPFLLTTQLRWYVKSSRKRIPDTIELLFPLYPTPFLWSNVSEKGRGNPVFRRFSDPRHPPENGISLALVTRGPQHF